MIRNILRNYRTTVIGCLLIATGIWLYLYKDDATLALPMVTTGLGFIVAKDANVNSSQY